MHIVQYLPYHWCCIDIRSTLYVVVNRGKYYFIEFMEIVFSLVLNNQLGEIIYATDDGTYQPQTTICPARLF